MSQTQILVDALLALARIGDAQDTLELEVSMTGEDCGGNVDDALEYGKSAEGAETALFVRGVLRDYGISEERFK